MAKELTRDQIEGRKEKAVRFVRDVLDDSDRADEIEDESLESYAQRRGFRIADQNPKGGMRMPTKEELLRRIDELQADNDDLQDQLDQVADIVAPPEEVEVEDEGDDNSDDENGDDNSEDDLTD